MNDKVECCNCGFFGVVPLGTTVCPECGSDHALAWVDDKQETYDPVTFTLGLGMSDEQREKQKGK
jgi:hypothetical protein